MTNEEAIKLIQGIEEDGRNVNSEHIEALGLAIKALETGEVCMSGEDYNMYLEGYKDAKKDFEPKQGEWEVHSCYKDVIICSNCNSGDNRWHKDFKFCPNCGAKMEGGAE